MCMIASLIVCFGATADAPWCAMDQYDSFQIVVAPSAIEREQEAARELQRYWEMATGHAIPISETPGDGINVWIGRDGVPTDYYDPSELEGLSHDGFFLRSVSPRDLIIIGARPYGTLFGVYQFLEDYLGIRWLTPQDTYIPETPPASLPAIDYRYVPIFEYRYSTYMNREANVNYFRQVQRYIPGPSFSCHTFYRYVDPLTYFPTNPEYFSLINGKRVAPQHNYHDHEENRKHPESQAQLCMSNPDVIDILTEKVCAEAEKDPENKYHHISQMDWANYCRCDNCAALDKKEGTPMGSVLYALNQVAERLAERHPGHKIETLAYTYTRQPPKHMKPTDNIAIKLCSIECDFSRPLNDPQSRDNRRFANDIRRWAKIAPRLHVWDYTTNFRNFQSPFPNFHVLQPNLQFFAEHNVKGMFEQGSYDRGAEFAPLRTYMISKLMWNPYADADAIMDEFLRLYYREAAPYIKEYIDLLTDRVNRDEVVMGFADEGRWMDSEMVRKSEDIFARAFDVIESQEVRDRVNVVYATVQYSALKCPPDVTIKDGTIRVVRPPAPALEDYIASLRSYGVQNIVDYFPFEEFYRQMPVAPPREKESTLETIENDHFLIWVAPGLSGSVIRWRDKDRGIELLRGYEKYDSIPGTWEDWVSTPGIAEHPVTDKYTVVERTPTSLTIEGSLDNGLVIRRKMSLADDMPGVQLTLSCVNTGNEPITLNLKTHPEFYTQDDTIPEIWGERKGKWELITDDVMPDVTASGLLFEPNGITRWAARLPKAKLTIVNDFDPEEVDMLLYFFSVNEHALHVNLELVMANRVLAPGDEHSFDATYWLTKKKPQKLD